MHAELQTVTSRSSDPVEVRTARHELTLYPDPGPFFEALERAIDAARERVWLETYIYRDDELGAPFAEHLVAAVKRGVDVRLLYDPQGSRGADPAFFASLRARGVQVRAYRPWRLARKRWAYWPRDHGRIVVVDHSAHTGGINWGVEWLPPERGGHDWHDVSIAVRGPCVADFELVFQRRWAEATEEDEIADYVSENADDVELIADSPAHSSIVLRRFCAAVQAAERRVWIENSYCVPPKILLHALSAAAQRGVDVQLLVPGKSDLPSIQRVTRGEYREWLQARLCVHEYQPRVMHSKFALVDDDWSTVGTFNAISPGVWWANEVNVVIREPRFVAELARVFERDVAQSTPVTESWIAARPWHLRLWERVVADLYRAVELLVVGAGRAPRLLSGRD